MSEIRVHYFDRWQKVMAIKEEEGTDQWTMTNTAIYSYESDDEGALPADMCGIPKNWIIV